MADKPWDKFDDPPWGPSEDLLLEPPPVEKQLEADWAALWGQEPDVGPPARMSDDELRAFVLGVLDGSLYTSDQVRGQDLIPMVFLPIAFGALKDWSQDQLKEIGVLYAPMSTALPRSINGHPIFPEVRLVHRDDWVRAIKAIRRESARRHQIEI